MQSQQEMAPWANRGGAEGMLDMKSSSKLLRDWQHRSAFIAVQRPAERLHRTDDAVGIS
jgi:hypothetical protein